MVQLISEFDIWKQGYAYASVSIYVGGTTTLATIYKDMAMTIAADNPQTLIGRTDEVGNMYGKFAVPLYTAQSYYTLIAGNDETGIHVPALVSLNGVNASSSLITATNSSYAVSAANIASRIVHASNFGILTEGNGGSAATNTDTLNLAIASLSDGGEVVIPSGTYEINALNIPANVIVSGQGKNATVLESILGTKSFTITGSRSGFRKITLDGNNLSAGSVGVYAVGINEIIFNEVTVKRFETGLYFKGGKGHIWTDFSIENTVNGAKLYGDLDSGNTNNGADFTGIIWNGGAVILATIKGIELSYEDKKCNNITFNGVGFEDCTGVAVFLNGAQFINFNGTWFTGNTGNVEIQDDTATLTAATASDNDVIGVFFNGGRIKNGTFKIKNTAQDVILKGIKLDGVAFTLSTPVAGPVVLLDCTEDSAVTISGESTKLLRYRTSDTGSSFGLTTGSAATKAWSIPMSAGQVVYLEARVIAKQRNGAGMAAYHIGCGAYRAGDTLAYDTQTANFNVGQILTGASSGAKARIVADADSGTTGTLTLTDIVGVFLDNEIITDDGGSIGSATVNGTLTVGSTSLDTVGVTSLRTAYETDATWACTFAVNGQEIELQVTGAASKTVEWTANVSAVST